MAYALHYLSIRCRECEKPSSVIVERETPLCGECFCQKALERWRTEVARILALRAERRRAVPAAAGH